MIPFHCGSQYADWRSHNCETCVKGGSFTSANETNYVYVCDIEAAIDEAYALDGEVSDDIGTRMGAPDDMAYTWRCPEYAAKPQE